MESDKVYTVVEALCVEDTNVLDNCNQFLYFCNQSQGNTCYHQYINNLEIHWWKTKNRRKTHEFRYSKVKLFVSKQTYLKRQYAMQHDQTISQYQARHWNTWALLNARCTVQLLYNKTCSICTEFAKTPQNVNIQLRKHVKLHALPGKL